MVILPAESSGPTLFETAQLAALPEFGCVSAINLDGGPSSGYWVNAKVPFAEPPVRIGHSLAIVPN